MLLGSFDQSQVLGVKLSGLVMGDDPYRSHRLPFDIEWRQKRLCDGWRDRGKIWVVTLRMHEKLHRITIKNNTAGPETTRRTAPDLRLPCAGDSGPKEIASVLGEQTDAGGAGPANLQRDLDEFLKSASR